MKEYIKKFSNHSEYTAFTQTTSFIKPNVSLCVQENDVHYNPWSDPRLVITFDINAEDFDDSGLRLYFDDFPQNVCDDEYDGDMAAFKQNVINNIDNASPEELNEYKYTGETYEYEGNTYYLWECTYEDRTNLKYLLTDRLNFDGLSLEDNINANHCPFIYILDEDKNIIYDNTDHPNYYLVAVRSTGFDIDILSDDSNVDEIEIDGNILSDVVTSYTFNTPGKHIVKYTLSNPTEVTESMFNKLSYLQSINIPNSVTYIDGSAFYGCSDLTLIKVENENQTYDSRNNCNAIIETSTNKLIVGCKNTIIPNSVTRIEAHAFWGCSGLTSVTIPNSVTSIGSYAFQNCSSLTSVTIPNSVTSIGGWAFSDCSALTSVNIPNSVTYINSCVFQNCSSLVSINIPNSVTTIGYRAFSGCSSLASITIPEFVTSIGNQAFNSCSSLTNVILNSNTIVSKTYTMSSSIEQIFGTQVTKYILDDNITTIGDYAFFGCSSLTSLTIGNSVTSIGSHAFERCYGLTTVTIPNSVTTIGSWAFADCHGLTSVSIGNSVTTIGQCAFHGCGNIASITCNATTAPTIYNQTFDVKRNGILYVPVGSTGYNVWMDTDSYYLGWHKWTKVEQ